MFGYDAYIDWSQFTEQERAVIQGLPHGSGIDCVWTVKRENEKLVCRNSYHVMNEHGYYIGYADFSIRWTPGQFGDFRLMFHGQRAQYLARYYSLREYLEDTFSYSVTP